MVSNHTDTEMIEAKSRVNHAKVREALGQILDYCHNTTTQFTRVTALFPHTPAEGDVAMLHRYGIDVLHRDNVGAFHRNPAPEAARLVWSATPFPTSATTPSTTAITLPQRPTPQPPGRIS